MKKVNVILLMLMMSLLVSFWYFECTAIVFTKSCIYNYLQSKYQSIYSVKSKSYSNMSSEVPVEMEPIPGDKHIIFIEPRCVLEDMGSPGPGLSLTKRQACAVESAAKRNPDYTVYVLHTCPINGKLEDTSSHERAMFQYPNIKLWKLNITRHLADTPLANWDFMKAISLSHWPIEHSSDLLRFVTLWKYGGIYLDLDVTVMKSLSELGTNYVAVESAQNLVIGCMNFASESMGHEMANNCINEILNDFRGDIWSHNAARVLSIALLKICNVSKVSEISAEMCKGFRVLSNKEFYAIQYSDWNLFFNEVESENVMNTIKDSYGVHVWNFLSKNKNVTVGSKQPYNLIAEISCPWVLYVAGEYF